jgi:protein-S-isoprenylcysteine O-methyltransferase Ste14
VIIRSIPEAANTAIWLLWWVSWLLAAFWRDRAAKQPARGSQIWYRLLVVAGVLLLFQPIVPLIDVRLWHSPVVIQWTIVAVTVAGFAFTWWARIHLGRLWSSNVGRKADHHIVDTGPYGLVRHPIYTGIIIATISTAALRATAGAWIGVALLTFGWYVKARLEERFLRVELGPGNYDAYARRVPMLVPFTR